MISERVREQHQSFIEFWRPALARHPYFELDGLYPSLRVLDLILLPSRGMPESHKVLDHLLRGVVSTFAIAVHDTLERAGRSIDVELGTEGVTLVYKGETEAQTKRAPLERNLQELLRTQPRTIRFFRNFQREVPLNGSWLGPMFLGLVLESSPLIEDCDLDVTDELMAGAGRNVLNEVARQCSEWYGKHFPDEQLGQVAELYLSGLLFPPFQFQEPVPALKAVEGLVQFMKEFSISNEKMFLLTRNLSFFADEQISSAGLAFHVALHEGPVTPELFGVCRRHGAFVGVIREALLAARKLLFNETDWIAQTSEYGEAQSQMITKEIQLGFFPWLELPAWRIAEIPSNEKLALAVRAMADFDIARAKANVDLILETDPGEIDLRLQRVYFDYIEGEHDRALAGAKALLTEPEAETNAAVHNFLGSLLLLKGEASQAVTAFERARQFVGGDFVLSAKITNNYAWALMVVERFQDALDVIDLSLGGIGDNLIIRMNRVSALMSLNRAEEAIAEQQEVLRVSPFYHQSFYALCHPFYLLLGEQLQGRSLH